MRVGVWPGASRGGNPFVDVFADALRGAGAEVLDITNPAAITPGSIDFLHIHWPEQVFWAGGGGPRIAARLWRTVRALRRLKRAGVAVVWMVHNLRPHDMSWARRAVWRAYQSQLCAMCDGFMTLSPGTVDVVREAIPALARKPACAVWHPAYPQTAPNPAPASIRARLGVPPAARLYGFLGLLRPYKGIETLIEAFASVPGSDVRLVVAGQALDSGYVTALRTLAAADPRVVIEARALPRDEYAAFQCALDVTVLPFHLSLHSGSIVHALGGRCPVLTPETPFARALAGVVGPGWVTLYERPLRAHHLIACQKPLAPPDLTALDPVEMGRRTVEFYAMLMQAAGRMPGAR